MRSRIHDCDYIGTLNARNLNTRSLAAVRVGALSRLMQVQVLLYLGWRKEGGGGGGEEESVC